MLREEGNATFDPADVNGTGSESDHLEESVEEGNKPSTLRGRGPWEKNVTW